MPDPATAKPAAKCAVEMHDRKPCGRAPYANGEKCICHSDRPDRDLSAFWSEIESMLARKDYDFTCFVFPDDARHFATSFEGPVWFPLATFRGPADFVDTRFQGDADFMEATFCATADFSDTEFYGRTDFFGAEFRDEASFHKAEFHQHTSFSFARFHRGGEFSQAMFMRAAWFSSTGFQEYAGFGWAEFLDEARFDHAGFEGPAVFAGYDDGWVFSREADVDFRLADFGHAENALFEHVFLGRARFLRADVRRVDLTDVDWARRSGSRSAVWDELTPEEWDEQKDYALIAKLYRQLKHNYEEQRDPITAGDFHFGEMHMRRLSNPPSNRLLRFLKRNVSFLALYRWVSGYGEDYLLALGWVVGVVAAFAFAFAYHPAFALHPSPSNTAAPPMQGFWSRFWYSVMCFLLRGDWSLQPVHPAGHYLSVAEGVIGPPLVAMFILALNRRFKR